MEVYFTSHSYTVRLIGGNVIWRGASGSELSARVAGGPLNRLHPGPPGGGVSAADAVSWRTRVGPLAWTPDRWRVDR